MRYRRKPKCCCCGISNLTLDTFEIVTNDIHLDDIIITYMTVCVIFQAPRKQQLLPCCCFCIHVVASLLLLLHLYCCFVACVARVYLFLVCLLVTRTCACDICARTLGCMLRLCTFGRTRTTVRRNNVKNRRYFGRSLIGSNIHIEV